MRYCPVSVHRPNYCVSQKTLYIDADNFRSPLDTAFYSYIYIASKSGISTLTGSGVTKCFFKYSRKDFSTRYLDETGNTVCHRRCHSNFCHCCQWLRSVRYLSGEASAVE